VKLGPPGLARTGAVPGAVDPRAGAEIEKAVGVGVGVGVGVIGAGGVDAIPPPPSPPQPARQRAMAIVEAKLNLRFGPMPDSLLLYASRGFRIRQEVDDITGDIG
jgi:hypothetical protein